MPSPKSYDVGVTAVFTMKDATTNTQSFGNRTNLDLALKLSKESGFIAFPVSAGVSKLVLFADIDFVTVTEI